MRISRRLGPALVAGIAAIVLVSPVAAFAATSGGTEPAPVLEATIVFGLAAASIAARIALGRASR